jgi:dienelactone hydrolase
MRTLCVALALVAFAHAEPRPFPVGFHSSIAFDQSRKYDGRKGRPILLAVWYPSLDDGKPPIPYSRYLVVPEAPQFPKFKASLEAFVLDEVTKAGTEQIFATPTTAHLDAPNASGPFPVVIYHPGAGGSFEENSALFEYLASHGYVVVSSAFQSPYPRFISNNIGGIERSGPDLDFIAHQARQWPYADAARIAVMGHSAGAQNLLEWIGERNCPASAYISFDTTLEYTPEDFKGHKSVRDEFKRRIPPHIPGILFAQARRNPRFETFDSYLIHSPHYVAAVAEFNHIDFLTHSFVHASPAVRRGYEALCQTVLAFLDYSLKSGPPLESDPNSPFAIRFKPAH